MNKQVQVLRMCTQRTPSPPTCFLATPLPTRGIRDNGPEYPISKRVWPYNRTQLYLRSSCRLNSSTIGTCPAGGTRTGTSHHPGPEKLLPLWEVPNGEGTIMAHVP
ncbi:PREDICTED: uncharacterized protein LOC105581190 isoform X8 [Cercocebus atys]|uniref:uncharacterized protein LOC105581190 isoform X8 n=1 Tax=Cercocebus atys TaxID=9531 RepID=UPI0005F5749D|nr:PREDICTED: uncharacterized protein LOC105581190 isoform X8 [Cercocebus atys]XP_011905426.1 PREDICTED: uncharacterized protein LOC105581190 isoform X8 [Cercocebus atys]XP_011905427.1 PREDICTED: uncharacterized protein LOC105581190 isoform X8 [Cercocebus atys]XP_011905429.1 PREDICTED: uncharacterized protein LOC105581190 isoform X8 [Cercocebus atys]